MVTLLVIMTVVSALICIFFSCQLLSASHSECHILLSIIIVEAERHRSIRFYSTGIFFYFLVFFFLRFFFKIIRLTSSLIALIIINFARNLSQLYNCYVLCVSTIYNTHICPRCIHAYVYILYELFVFQWVS